MRYFASRGRYFAVLGGSLERNAFLAGTNSCRQTEERQSRTDKTGNFFVVQHEILMCGERRRRRVLKPKIAQIRFLILNCVRWFVLK
jgi:hypothetical protein